ncbi:MAG: MFS transporter, partial [Solobacterium sp.]|nr:MFS transporter [Solobacterium sp.]
GVGNALITVFTVKAVSMLGAGSERTGFGKLALIVAVLFIITEVITCLSVKEQRAEKMQTNTISEMFRALFANDQAMVTVMTIILINCALYLTSNLIIYFFKYDLGGASWQDSYTLFNMVGGASQILGMMVLYPLLRKKFGNTDIFKMCLRLAIVGYALILLVCMTGFASNVILLCLCGLCVFLANGMMTVLTTVFLSSSVDYGEMKTGHREESVIFSMQTFVVKAASGVAVFMTGIGLDMIGLTGSNATDGIVEAQSASTILGLRLLMTILPVIGLLCAYMVFTKKFTLTDQKVQEISMALREKAAHDAD